MEAAGERQPLRAAGLALLYEGRVDNRVQVAGRLGKPHLANASDGSVLVEAFKTWGERLSATVIGEYAYAVVDYHRHRIVAGHDSLGVRRIWYRQRGTTIWIASDLGLLFEAFDDARDAVDADVLPEYFSGLMVPTSGRTIWRGLRELKSGAALCVADAAARETVVWVPADGIGQAPRSVAEVDETFRELLFEGVRCSLRSPGGVLCDLSGGFDSSTVAATAALLSDGSRALIGWATASRRSKNELRLQDSVHARYGIPFERVPIEECPSFETFEPGELPVGGFLQVGAEYKRMRSFAQRHGLTCRLTGHAADALLQKGTAPPIYLADWIRSGRIREWGRHLREYLELGLFSAVSLLGQCTVGTLDPLACQPKRALPEWLTYGFRQRVVAQRHRFLSGQTRTFASDARERLYRFTLGFIPMPKRMLQDERMPLLHRPLVEWLLSLDWSHVVIPGQSRVLMRRALHQILPEEVQTVHADGQHSASFLEGLQRNWSRVSRLASGEHLASLGVVERRGFRTQIEQLRTGFDGQQHQFLMTALYLEIWLALRSGRRTESVMDDALIG